MDTNLTHIGYSPLSAKYRTISDGSKYDHLFPAPDLKATVLKKDGSVEDTVQMMKRIIKQYSHQVRDLAKILKGRTIRESAENVFNFVFKYIKYNVEKGEQLRTPAYTWYCAQVCARQGDQFDAKNSADCDCMAIFCGSLFYEMKIPFALRIAAYKDIYGSVGNWQHVYVIVYGDGETITCDPVTHKFNYEKPTGKEKTFPMSLNGNDIIMLSGVDGEGSVYEEREDGSVGLLSGRKKRKERRKARRQARKEKRAAKKAYKKAKKRGDKEGMKAAKAAKKAAKKKLRDNRGGIAKAVRKVGKAIVKFTKKTALLVPRASFLLLLRLNFRGLAKRLASKQKARDKFAKVWKNLGGSMSKLNKAIEKGKKKKALFGSKKLKGDLEGQLSELGLVLENHGVIDMDTYLGSLGLGAYVTASVGASIASAIPIIKKILSVMKSVGEKIPETAEEAQADGEDTVDADENENIVFDENEVDDGEKASDITLPENSDTGTEDSESGESESGESEGGESEGGDEEADEDLEGAYFVRDDGELCSMDGLGNITVLGKLFNFKKKNKKAKKSKSEKKAARASKKASKKAKKKAKKTAKADKKAAKKAAKKSKKASKKTKKTPLPAPAPSASEEDDDAETTGGKRSGKAKQWLKDNLTIDNAAAAMELVDTFTKKKQGNNTDALTDHADLTVSTTPPADDKKKQNQALKKGLKWGAIVIGAIGVGLGVRALVKSNKPKKLGGLDRLNAIKLK